MKKFRRGIREIVVGLLGGLLFSAVLSFFTRSGLIPSNLVIWFTVIGLISSLITIFSFSDGGNCFHIWLDSGRMVIEKLDEQYRFSCLFLGAGGDTGFQSIRFYQETGFPRRSTENILTDSLCSIIIGAILIQWRAACGFKKKTGTVRG